MQTTPRIGFWLDNSNQTPQQTVETILNVRTGMIVTYKGKKNFF